MFRKFKNKFLWIRNSGVTQTMIGFVGFLIIAALIMLLLEAPEEASGIRNLFSSLWFSIVTVTTVGYGDLSPISSWGKVAAVVIMFIGILYIGVLTGNITSWLVERNRRRVFGMVPIKKKEGHFLILGWRQGMEDLLKDILRLHNKDSDYLVLVNSAESRNINKLRQDPDLKELSYFSGDYTNSEVLKNACGQSASKVLILSEELSSLTIDEVDFKSVLATIAIKRQNPQIYAIVEIIQPKFSLYLQHIEVEEIILNRSSSRALLSNIALMSGLNNVFTRFFSMKDGLLKIESIDSALIGKTYSELRLKNENYFILGIIENSGNLRNIKTQQLEAVHSSITIRTAIQALDDLKKMQSNVPIFHPSPNYIIKQNSSMIILGVQEWQINASEGSKETIIEEQSSIKPIEAFLANQVINGLKTAKTWYLLVDVLRVVEIEFYQYINKINGVLYQNKKYPFEALNLSPLSINQINKLFEKNTDKKAIIQLKLKEFLNLSLDWDEFFDRIRQEGMDFYRYRNKINGIKFEGKNFSFKDLKLESQIVEEIQKIKAIQADDKSIKKSTALKLEHHSLASIINQLKSKSKSIKPKSGEKSKYLMICGWKPQLPDMLRFIISEYSLHNTDWNRISVVANVDDSVLENFNSQFSEHVSVELFQGSIVDRDLLKEAGITKATKVIILAETESGKSFEEIDSQTVLAAMMIVRLNKKAYKVAEILDKRYKESLEQANVEEIYLEDEFTRIMLSNGSHGVGITKVIGELVNFRRTSLRTRIIENRFVNRNFKQLVREQRKPGELIIGLLEETGNINVRKSERIHQAQIQSNIIGQVEELIKVKELEPNRVVIAPESDYVIPPNSQLISLISSDPEGWDYFQNLKI